MEEYISISRKISGPNTDQDAMLKNLMREIENNVLPESGITGDQQWTLADLENVVYEFVNFNGKRVNQDFLETRFKNQDVSKDDLMKI